MPISSYTAMHDYAQELAVIEWKQKEYTRALNALYDGTRLKRKFNIGDRVKKNKGSSWQGKIVGFYSTELTPVGYCVESELETGSVQIYPEEALHRMLD